MSTAGKMEQKPGQAGGTNMAVELRKADSPTRKSFSERMVEYGSIDKEFVVFESDIGYSTYSYLFGEKYPDRYFNMGIAELGTMAAAAGFAGDGRTVIVSGYGVFLTMRAVEVVRSFICYPHLNVKILSSHGGLTAAIDGVTHQATEDIAYMSTLPEMKVLAPCDTFSARAAFDIAVQTPGPVFTRLMRDPLWDIYTEKDTFRLGGSHVLREGKDITLVSYGDIVFQALEAADLLAREGIDAEVIDMYSVKPFDAETLLGSARRTKAVLVAENHQRRNGLGYEIGTYLLKHYPWGQDGSKLLKFDHLGLDDTFGESGNYFKVIDKYGISARAIAEAARRLLSPSGH
ncbi:MAG: transketolase family protein [Spirochaetales bacterium]